MTVLGGATVAACSLAAALAGIRWLRVAQREHYLPGSVTRFALRWWGQDPATGFAFLVALVGVVLAWRWRGAALTAALVVAFGPPGLGLRGRTSPLAWTRRLTTLAAVSVVLAAAAVAVAALLGQGPVGAGAVALAVPVLVDLGSAVTGPFETVAARTYVRRARERLLKVAPTVVAITGSYGKTSTKGYVAHLVAGSRTVVASPASFNNRAGLARAVNENLADGTDVFVAEMGTYGPGEIAELSSWLVPDIAVITAIGPVHLERFRTEDRIVEAKAEILPAARAVVLNVDDERLALLAVRAEERGQRVRRVSAESPDADVYLRRRPPADGPGAGDDGAPTLVVDGTEVGPSAPGAQPGNVACAVAVALELGVPVAEIGRRIPTLPTAPHRLEAGVGAGGFLVLDDTYNANPAGAGAALEALTTMAPPSGRKVVVTPGMVELGPVQAERNAAFGRAAAAVADDLVVVGRTNRRALLAGANGGATADGPGAGREPVRCVVVADRNEAVAWVRDHLGPGDIVLYENDLPDHYP
jgi:UDP-N-acetylmuramoyl-tripeptide--D-alanyl-D-alanine ligase